LAITKQKGDIAEAYITFLLKKHGFNVLLPWGEDTRYDMVTEKNGVFKRIQVKYVSSRNGSLEVPMRSCNNHQIIHYSRSHIDIVAAYDPQGNKVYFIPLKKHINRSTYKLRILPAKNKQKKYIHLASLFESNFSVLEK
jgi:Holliday junction resolvase-like predicted endonuclease